MRNDKQKICLRLGDGLYNAGLLGFMKVLDFGGIPNVATGTELVFSVQNGMENFTKAYFGCLLDCFGRRTAAQNLKNALLQIRLRAQDRSDTFLQFLADTVKALSERMAMNSYVAAAQIAQKRGEKYDFQKEARKIKSEKEVEKQIAALSVFLEKFDTYLDVFQMKDIAYNYVQLYWNGIAFLHRQKTTEEFEAAFQMEFMLPVESFHSKKNKAAHACFQCGRKLPPGVESLAWINDQGVDIRRKTNGFWNFEVDLALCPYCRLVYACLPLGFRTMGREGIFINDNRSLRRLREANLYDMADGEAQSESFGALIGKFVLNAEMTEARNRLENIQVIRRDASGYRVNILSPRLLRSLTNARIPLKVLLDRNRKIFREVLSAVLDGRELYDYIIQGARYALQKGYSVTIYYNVLLIQRILYSKGDNRMKTYMEEGRRAGKALQARIAASVNEKKTTGLTYALLTALQTRDADRFVLILIRQYTSLNMEIPEIFFSLKESDRAFQDIGQAFIMGLHAGKRKDLDKEAEQ